MVVQRFTRDRIVRQFRSVATATVLGGVIGLLASAIVGLGVQYLGPLEGYRLGAVLGAVVGGVYGGASGLGIRGLIGGVLVGAAVGAGIGNSAWNFQVLQSADPQSSYDPLRFPAIGLDKILVMGLETGVVVGAIAGSIPADRLVPEPAAA